MVRITSLLSTSISLALALADGEANRNVKGGLQRASSAPDLRSRDLSKRCQGTCSECFGAGYIDCPNSSYYCYLPGDATYGLDSCTGGSVSSAAPAPTSTGTAGTSDFCSGKGATCVTCFGTGYLQCSDGLHCYNPSDPNYATCPSGTTSAGSPSSTSSTSACAEQYGTGSVDCGTDSCYNPGEGDVCCAGGYHCEGGNTCSSETGYCCSPGSTSSGCSGSGGGLSYSSYSYTYSYSSYSYEPTTTDSFSSDATPTDSSTTGVSQIGSSSAGDKIAELKVVGVLVCMFGLGMLLL